MLNLRNLVFAAATAAVTAGVFAPPVFAAESDASACRQQGYRKFVKGVWHHYVTVFVRRGWYVFSHEVDCGPAF